MAFVAVDKDGVEWIFNSCPHREEDEWMFDWCDTDCIELPPGSIVKLIGRGLTWEDEPVELTEN